MTHPNTPRLRMTKDAFLLVTSPSIIQASAAPGAGAHQRNVALVKLKTFPVVPAANVQVWWGVGAQSRFLRPKGMKQKFGKLIWSKTFAVGLQPPVNGLCEWFPAVARAARRWVFLAPCGRPTGRLEPELLAGWRPRSEGSSHICECSISSGLRSITSALGFT